MINAKQEFIDEIRNLTVLCATIELTDNRLKSSKTSTLRCGYSEDEYQSFLSDIDFNYHNGFGRMVLFGKIWYTDGSWSERSEYDGAEWWEHRCVPDIPEELKAK